MINRIIKSVLIIQLLLINYTVQAQCPVDSITQNESFNLDFGGLTSCGDLTNNSFFRVFDLSAEFGITEDYQIDSVTFGSAVFFSDPNVSEARGYVNIYSLEAGLDFNLDDLQLLASQEYLVTDEETVVFELVTLPISSRPIIESGQQLVIELFTNVEDGALLFFLENNDPQTAPWFSQTCDNTAEEISATSVVMLAFGTCVEASPIPTLGEWGLLFLCLLLSITMIIGVRNRNKSLGVSAMRNSAYK